MRKEVFPPGRVATIDTLELAKGRHHVAAFCEADVTLFRERYRQAKEDGTPVSFTAWILGCAARACREFPRVHSFYRRGRCRYIPETVDATVVIEVPGDGETLPLPVVMRNVDEKSTGELSRELHELKMKEREKAQKGDDLSFRLYALLPAVLRRLLLRVMLSSAEGACRRMGSLAITSLGMFGRGSCWSLPVTMHPLCIAPGTVSEKPVVSNGKVVVREILNLTILFDHDVIDGAPAARFIARLLEIIEEGEL